jgi:trehalose utilization protein
MEHPPKITVWNEFVHEQKPGRARDLYPDGIHAALADHFRAQGFPARTATLEEPEHGLSDAVLKDTDVLFWWGHAAHDKVSDGVARRVQQQVLSGMGLVVLHSGHYSKIFRALMGTNCSLTWREAGEREILWNLAPGHPITEGIGERIEIDHHEMYGEPFDIPKPDEVIFTSWFAGGNVFRSGCTFARGHGKIFYFSPGHETHPVYHHPEILRVLVNAARWARPALRRSTEKSPKEIEPKAGLN